MKGRGEGGGGEGGGRGLVVVGGGAAVVAGAVVVPFGQGRHTELPGDGLHGQERHAAEDVLPVDGLYVPDGQERHAAEDVLAVDGS